ncbi:MAG: polysaccharide deacetylase family protein [Clostridia bacterium]|nr:polysaccharide deacetylase family protein [Clostridia bacterium]
MKKIITALTCVMCVCLFLITQAYAVSDEALNWYCVRNKEHKQPRLDTNMSFIDQYDAYYVDKAHTESSDEKVIYLTFDAGYENGNIEKVLDVMKAEDVTGAFFILENLINKNPELVCRMADEGHIVANHTSHHKDMTKIDNIEDFAAELDELNELYKATTGKDMAKYYRPPEGRFDERSLSFAKELGYKTVFWSFAYADWDNQKQPSADAAKAKIFENLHNGAIILLHPTSATNAEILSDVIKTLKADGYRFGTLDELTEK